MKEQNNTKPITLIGISGKSGSGKDTVGKIIQYLIDVKGDITDFHIDDLNEEPSCDNAWKIVKFAESLKDIVCILTGCTREQLESQEFKNSNLPIEWEKIFRYESLLGPEIKRSYTFREALQVIGTDLFRYNFHSDVWVNALFSKYDKFENIFSYDCKTGLSACIKNHKCHTCNEVIKTYKANWIVTDLRFPNEAKAIKDREGIIIRVERDKNCEVYGLTRAERRGKQCNEITCPDGRRKHESETALDNYAFNYVIDNNSSIEELIEKVKEVLIKEKII